MRRLTTALMLLSLTLLGVPLTHGQGTVTLPIHLGARSTGISYMSFSDVAGATGTTANLLVRFGSTGALFVVGLGANDAIGIAVNTAAGGGEATVAISGVFLCVADNAVTFGHLLVVGTATAGRCRDAGTSSPDTILASTQIVGMALDDASTGATVPVYLMTPGMRGSFGSPLLSVLASDVTNATTTLTDVTGVFCAIGASSTEIWQFEIQARMTGPVAGDYKVGFSVPTSALMEWGSHSPALSQDFWGPSGAMATAGNTLLIQTDTLSMAASNTTFDGLYLRGFIFGGGTAGNVQFRFAQGTGPSGTSTIKKATTMLCRKLLN